MFEIFLERADQLSRARKELLKKEQDYRSAIALLAVHSTIALNDALWVKLTGKRFKDDNHQSVVKATEKLCAANRLEPAGIKHLQTLISKKTQVSYQEKSVSTEVALALSLACERFEDWAYRHLKDIS